MFRENTRRFPYNLSGTLFIKDFIHYFLPRIILISDLLPISELVPISELERLQGASLIISQKKKGRHARRPTGCTMTPSLNFLVRTLQQLFCYRSLLLLADATVLV